MRRLPGLLLSPACAALVVSAGAQDPAAVQSLIADDLRVPVHSAPDDPVAGAYGVWAAGPDYKVSFHDGFAFYPLLGPSYPANLPLRWVETSITVADRELTSAREPERDHSDWRYEYRHAGWTEAYDVRKDGVEQSFVFVRAPLGAGDLVISGAIQTRLRAAVRAPEVASIVFTDQDGRPLVEYGSAVAFDAVGRSTAIPTSFDGSSIRLHVPGEWLSDAVYPITVDPLTSRTTLGGEVNSRRVRDTDTIVAADRADPHSLLIVHSREFSGGDIDAFAFMYDKNFRNTGRVWNEITTSWNTLRPRCAFMNPTNDWLIAFERQVGGSSWVRLYAHDRANRTSNTGTLSFLNNPSGKVLARPDVGGQLERNHQPSLALVVFEERSFSDATLSDVKGVTYDTATSRFGTPFLIPAAPGGRSIRRTQPSVSSMTNLDLPWMATWQEIVRGSSTDDWDIHINLVVPSGQVFTAASIPANSLPGHKTGPAVEGDTEEYVLAFTLGSSFNRRVEYARIRWRVTQTSPTHLLQRTLVSGGLGSFPSLQGLGFDYDTRSHWCMMHYQSGALTATRVGHTGGVIESGTVHASPGIGAGSVSFTRGTGTGPSTVVGRFVLVHSDDDLFYPIYASHMTYPLSYNTYFGLGCHGGLIRAFPETGQALAGNGNFGYVATGLTPTAPVLFVFGINSGFTQIPGAPGCDLHLDPAVLIIGHSTTVQDDGTARFPLPLPDEPVFTGDLYTQCVWVDASLNTLGLGTTNGMIAPVR